MPWVRLPPIPSVMEALEEFNIHHHSLLCTGVQQTKLLQCMLQNGQAPQVVKGMDHSCETEGSTARSRFGRQTGGQLAFHERWLCGAIRPKDESAQVVSPTAKMIGNVTALEPASNRNGTALQPALKVPRTLFGLRALSPKATPFKKRTCLPASCPLRVVSTSEAPSSVFCGNSCSL